VIQGDREVGLRAGGKGAFSSRGIQATASKARASVKPGAIRSLATRFLGTVTNCREASGPERGYTISSEGNTLKGGQSRNGCGMK